MGDAFIYAARTGFTFALFDGQPSLPVSSASSLNCPICVAALYTYSHEIIDKTQRLRGLYK